MTLYVERGLRRPRSRGWGYCCRLHTGAWKRVALTVAIISVILLAAHVVSARAHSVFVSDHARIQVVMDACEAKVRELTKTSKII